MGLLLTGAEAAFGWDSGLSSLVHIKKVHRQVSSPCLWATSNTTAFAILPLVKQGQAAQHMQGEP